jgi:CRP-like cAMP-binding protein
MERHLQPQAETSILDRFPRDVILALQPKAEQLESHRVLIESDEQPSHVFFPHRGMVISLTRTSEEGATVEVGIVGSEGIAGVQAVLAKGPIGSEAIVQIPGVGSRVPLENLRKLMNDNVVVRDVVHRVSMSFLSQVSQHALCNRLHTVEQRLAKWLLGVRDRIDSDDIALTHEFLSHMLGIRRSGVTTAIGELALDGLISHQRSSVAITDREGLEARTCGCYGIMRETAHSTL